MVKILIFCFAEKLNRFLFNIDYMELSLNKTQKKGAVNQRKKSKISNKIRFCKTISKSNIRLNDEQMLNTNFVVMCGIRSNKPLPILSAASVRPSVFCFLLLYIGICEFVWNHTQIELNPASQSPASRSPAKRQESGPERAGRAATVCNTKSRRRSRRKQICAELIDADTDDCSLERV